MFATLGTITFEGVKSFSGLSQRSGVTYAEHALVDSKPKLQRTGEELETIALDMRFHISFCNPTTEIFKLRNAMKTSAIMPLTFGSGETLGRYVIESMDVTRTSTFGDGTILSATVSVELKEFYVATLATIARQSVKAKAFAVSTNSPLLSVKDNSTFGPGGQALASVKKARTLGQKLAAGAKKAQGLISAQQRYFDEAKKAVREVESNLEYARTLVNEGISVIKNAQRAYDSLTDSIAKAGQLKSFTDLGNITKCAEISRDLQDSISLSDSSLSGLAGMYSTRKYP